MIGSLLDLPFELYNTFRIEQRFGFNRMTWRLWSRPTLVKGIRGRRAVIGLPIAALMLWLMHAAGPSSGGCGPGASWMGFNLLILVALPDADRATLQ